ncbi:MAG: enoyl-CoA hydratase [Planctomycetaceae bacterium]|jgi:enoyl-CoA hydratase
MELVLTNTQNGVTTVTLNRPEQLNALSNALRADITKTFQTLKDDTETKVIILTGSGRAFCAGLDLRELGQQGFTQSAGPANLHDAIRGVGKPIIGAINGFAITGGFEIALMCDILVGSRDAKFADTHVRMGVVPGWGLSQRLAKFIGPSRAKELSFTGNYLDAEKAERWGLINQIIEPEQLMTHCSALASDICQTDPTTLKEVHRLIDFGVEHTLEQGLIEEALRSDNHKGDLSADTLDQRRIAVTERGRAKNP